MRAPTRLELQGTDRGEVLIDSLGQPFCEIGESLVASANIMPDGEDYFFAVQVVRDGSDGNTEQSQSASDSSSGERFTARVREHRSSRVPPTQARACRKAVSAARCPRACAMTIARAP